MKFYALCFFFTCVSAAPQDILFGNGRDDTTTTTDSQGGFFPNLFGGVPNRFPSFGGFFPSIFGDESGSDGSPGFPNIFDAPDFGDVPGVYDNSTYEVNDVNGTRVEVNRTVTRNEDGSFVFTKVFVKFTPDGEDGTVDADPAGTGTDAVSGGEAGSPASPPPAPEVPAENVDPSVNQVETEPLEDFS